ncbi:hypothetical protein [Butyrivibrio sp. YAB3001]|uniref:hypothetical protein n=1 Tax=Butyrivibrio sp. YAB3001 TaxID=1520812 RepID=UPI0008F65A38|nr:hypothetical protein [Butyrivibrio sp. YAB3001]SFB87629.1 hypothetical protein SAMN02910398_00969 [Butyrivibrio sp. YAB3001]
MFDRLLGDYMLHKGLIAKDKLAQAYNVQETKRAKLGVIAVSEKLLTIAQAEQVNSLQATMDKRFGDIAVEKGYLSTAQLGRLLELQGNYYLAFVQSLVDEGIMTMEQVNSAEEQYQREFGLTATDMMDLKSGDIDRIVPIFLDSTDAQYRGMFSVGIKAMYRLIDHHVYIGKAYRSNSVRGEVLGYQKFHGEEYALAAITGKYDDIQKLAISYTKEEFIETEEDALDAVCEFINCINGLYATDRSKSNIMIELEPPEFSVTYSEARGDEMIVMPVHISGGEISFLITTSERVEVA